jgi:hypothetical protein
LTYSQKKEKYIDMLTDEYHHGQIDVDTQTNIYTKQYMDEHMKYQSER